MIPDKGEGIIFFKDGKYVAYKIDGTEWTVRFIKIAVEKAKERLIKDNR